MKRLLVLILSCVGSVGGGLVSALGIVRANIPFIILGVAAIIGFYFLTTDMLWNIIFEDEVSKIREAAREEARELYTSVLPNIEDTIDKNADSIIEKYENEGYNMKSKATLKKISDDLCDLAKIPRGSIKIKAEDIILKSKSNDVAIKEDDKEDE